MMGWPWRKRSHPLSPPPGLFGPVPPALNAPWDNFIWVQFCCPDCAHLFALPVEVVTMMATMVNPPTFRCPGCRLCEVTPNLMYRRWVGW